MFTLTFLSGKEIERVKPLTQVEESIIFVTLQYMVNLFQLYVSLQPVFSLATTLDFFIIIEISLLAIQFKYLYIYIQ